MQARFDVLNLSHITFCEGNDVDQTERSSWIEFIGFLGSSMSLEYVRFQGNFSNGWDEAWVVDPGRNDQPDGSFGTVSH